MSFQAMAWAVVQKLPCKEKMVLLMLANHCNSHTGQCNPSLTLLADECGLSRDSVIRAIKKLESLELLMIDRKKAGSANLPNHYLLNLGGSSTERLGSRTEQPPSSTQRLGSRTERPPSRTQQLGVVAGCDSNLEENLEKKQEEKREENQDAQDEKNISVDGVSASLASLSQDEKFCFDWSMTEPFWASKINFDVREFRRHYYTGDLRNQFLNWKRKNPNAGANSDTGSNGNNNNDYRGHYALNHEDDAPDNELDMVESAKRQIEMEKQRTVNALISLVKRNKLNFEQVREEAKRNGSVFIGGFGMLQLADIEKVNTRLNELAGAE